MFEVRIGEQKAAFEAPVTVYDAAKEMNLISRAVLGAVIGDKTVALTTVIDTDTTVKLVTFEDEEGKKIFWHTASHILAQAVKRLYPQTKIAIGPAISNGFYYDFDTDIAFTPEILEQIEKEMAKIVKEDLRLERFTLPADEAKKLMADEPYKIELIEKHENDGEISFYKQGEFTDLCAGPHLFSTGAVKAIKLTQCTGAYWKGDSKNKMLQRIYGVAFPKKDELAAHLQAVEEAKKRDHNKLGRDLELFTTTEYIGQGLPILMPKGARIIQTLQRFVEDEEERRGYLLTKTPFMAKSDLYKISGHWQHYRDGMFILGNPDDEENEVFALRPMTCPFQFQAYLAAKRSYRDLPLRYNETSTLFRNESSGEMHGLIRVRQFTISEGHIACTPEQVEDEFRGCVDLAKYLLGVIGLEEDVTYRFSQWDPENTDKYIGSAEEWDKVQGMMKNILDNLGINYKTEMGEAAFYGPKLDIQIKNVHGKEDTLVTVQIDFQLAERFGMVYTDKDGTEKYPYVLHRTSIGCYERTLALLIEKYAGAFPTWLSPEQVRILPVSDNYLEYAKKIEKSYKDAGIRVTTDERSEKIGYKIRQAQLEKIPYMLIVGEKEVEANTVSVRSRANGELGALDAEEFKNQVVVEIATKKR